VFAGLHASVIGEAFYECEDLFLGLAEDLELIHDSPHRETRPMELEAGCRPISDSDGPQALLKLTDRFP